MRSLTENGNTVTDIIRLPGELSSGSKARHHFFDEYICVDAPNEKPRRHIPGAEVKFYGSTLPITNGPGLLQSGLRLLLTRQKPAGLGE